jgi:replication-associated recombination protein RarA
VQTIHGSDFFCALSAAQKMIRRGQVEEAAWWCFELADSGYMNALVNRLRVIAHEDIGTGDMTACLFAMQSLDDVQRWYPAKRSWRLALSNAIIALARAQNKSRDSDLLQAMTRWHRATQPALPIPDVALDRHTRAGSKLGRGIEHFVLEGTKLLPNDVSEPRWKAAAMDAFKFLDQQKRDAKEQAEEDEALAEAKQRRLGGST